MTVYEAFDKICNEFIDRYHEWLQDERDLSEFDYFAKYGFVRPINLHQDNVESLVIFQQHVFCGRYLSKWKKYGYTAKIMRELHRSGFLKYQKDPRFWSMLCSKRHIYYIDLPTAKQIWEESSKRKHESIDDVVKRTFWLNT